MSNDAEDFAAKIRPLLTRLHLLYFRQAQQNTSLTSAQLSIMINLAAHGAMRVSQIAASESISMPTASNAIDILEDEGFVSRMRNIEDKRGVSVQLTDAGREELDIISNQRDAQFSTFLESLPAEDLETAYAIEPMLEKLLDSYTQIEDS